MRRTSRSLTWDEVSTIFAKAGLEPPAQFKPNKRPKYNNKWTYYDGQTMHTTGRDCIPNCPVCTDPVIKADRIHWYQSRDEAEFASVLDRWQKNGEIYDWSRGHNILLLDGGSRSESIRYKPDANVWDKPGPVSRRFEVKGSRGMISQQGMMRIKMYRALVAKGLQPPLLVVDARGHEIQLVVNKRGT